MRAAAESIPLRRLRASRLAGPWDAAPAEASRWERARGALPMVVAGVQLLLLACTAPLWLLPWMFPAVPLIHAAAGWPAAADVACGLLLFLGWIGFAAFPAGSLRGRGGLLLVVVAFPLATMLNQHRLQPWAWHGWLFAVAWLGTPLQERAGWLRLLTVSIYLYSAASKFDSAFLHDLGPVLWTASGTALGLPAAWCESTAGPHTAWLAPTGELFIAIWLASGRGRRGATVAAVFMHVLLLAALGPWGLRHSSGVLGWNVLFILWDVFLFWPVAAPPEERGDGSRTEVVSPPTLAAGTPFAWPARLVLTAAMLLPLAEPWGCFDLWLSWGLYAPKNERCELWIDPRALPKLPAWARVEASSEPPPPELPADWRRIRLDRAALRVVGAPLYPQHRFQLGVALAASADAPEAQVAVVREDSAPRFGGSRRREVLRGRGRIEAAARSRYFWNAYPRPWSGG